MFSYTIITVRTVVTNWCPLMSLSLIFHTDHIFHIYSALLFSKIIVTEFSQPSCTHCGPLLHAVMNLVSLPAHTVDLYFMR